MFDFSGLNNYERRIMDGVRNGHLIWYKNGLANENVVFITTNKTTERLPWRCVKQLEYTGFLVRTYEEDSQRTLWKPNT